MPNDMSHLPVAAPSLTGQLAARASRYCARADILCRAPDLTVVAAAKALDHLAGLQTALAEERLRQCRDARADLARIEGQFHPHEAALKAARAALSSALLRAQPDPESTFGLVPHGAGSATGPSQDDGDTPVSRTSGAERVPPKAVSACRALLDLDALRPYLSDHALRHAIEAHARATGRHDLCGVAYAALPSSAHLPCTVS